MATGESAPTPLPGATYRFVVKSAEEAVRMIHEKLGESARVISVKQIGGGGLAGLLRAPQLEVIAEIPPAAAPAPAPVPTPVANPSPATAAPASPPLEEEEEFSWLDGGEETQIHGPPGSAPNHPLERLLSRAGIGEQILARWRRSPRWEQLKAEPLSRALKEVVEMLNVQWHEQTQRPLSARVAFFGSPGSGATTALCKALTLDIFFHQQASMVMKLDGEHPNPSEGLAMFCEALNVPLLRSTDEFDTVSQGHRLYVDVAGTGLPNSTGWRDLGRLLGEFYIETRVLVLNAAYEIDLLKRGYARGHEAGATHVVFTHLDEVHHWGKLWDLLLGGGLQPLFFSCGQNVSGDLNENAFDSMVLRMLGGMK